jgi:glutathione S-transferase
VTTPVVYGARYSVYVRIALLALEEKGVGYELQEVDIFAPGGATPEHLARHPFGKIPAFEHDGFVLYEAAAIARYIDEAFDGPSLQPRESQARARMAQVIGLLDAYAYRALVWDIFVERVRKPERGQASDEARIAAALPRAETCLAELERLLPADGLTLADLHAVPMLNCLLMTPEGRTLVAGHPRLEAWWRRMAARRSVQAVCTPLA